MAQMFSAGQVIEVFRKNHKTKTGVELGEVYDAVSILLLVGLPLILASLVLFLNLSAPWLNAFALIQLVGHGMAVLIALANSLPGP